MLQRLERQKQRCTWECRQGERGMCMGMPYEHRGYGIIEPVYDALRESYRQAMCPCEQEALMHYKQHMQQKEQMRQEAMLTKNTFAWLGERWSDRDLARKTFDTFDATRQPEAFEATQVFQDILKGTLILSGPYGTGKTHLLAALCNALHKRKRASLFVTAPKLFSAIQETISRNEAYTTLITRAIQTPLLVVDDIDKAKRSDFREEIYFAIIDERTKRGLPMAISTNRLAELENFVGGAVCSRLKMGQIPIEMMGDDYREEMP